MLVFQHDLSVGQEFHFWSNYRDILINYELASNKDNADIDGYHLVGCIHVAHYNYTV